MSFYGGSRLPFARLQNLPKLPKRFPAAPRRHSGRGEPFLQLQQVPEAVAMSFYGGSRLPFARLQNSPKLPKRFPAAPRRHSGAVNLSCSSNKSLKPWQCPFMAVQGCRLPGFKTRQNSPNASLRGEPFLQLQQVPEAVAMSFYGGSRLPFARLQNSPKLPKRFPAAPRRHSGRGEPFLQLQQVPEAVAMSFYGGSRLPFASLQNSPKLSKRFPAAPRRHSGRGEPFLQLQQVSKPWQCPFMEVPAVCHFKSLPKRFPAAPRRLRPRSCSSNKSLRPWQCPFKEVQGCRLPGFKTRQNSPNASLQLPGATQAAVNLSCSSTSP